MQNVKLIFVVNSGLKQKKDPTKIWKKWVMPLQASTKIFSKKKKNTSTKVHLTMLLEETAFFKALQHLMPTFLCIFRKCGH